MEQKTIFEAKDGTRFDEAAECEKHEANIGLTVDLMGLTVDLIGLTVDLSSVIGIAPRRNYLIIYTTSGITHVTFDSDASANDKLEVKTKFMTAWRTVNGDSDMHLYEFSEGTIVDLDHVIGVRPYGNYLTIYTISGAINVRFDTELSVAKAEFIDAWQAAKGYEMHLYELPTELTVDPDSVTGFNLVDGVMRVYTADTSMSTQFDSAFAADDKRKLELVVDFMTAWQQAISEQALQHHED
ncbi:MAG: hypothetical protein M3H12_20015 [Chromatiales bacterium]|nr:hypothetical protein [Gammaproteobacteria bacterium]